MEFPSKSTQAQGSRIGGVLRIWGQGCEMKSLFKAVSLLSCGLAYLASPAFPQASAQEAPVHGLAMHGAPALPPEAPHLPYADPEAVKGGSIVYGLTGSFDSVQPFIIRGSSPFWVIRDLAFESLLTRNHDEPFTLYGLLAESVETPEDRSWALFTIREEARFSDGSPVTPEDVIFSMEVLRDQGRPNYGSSYRKVSSVEKVGERGVRFVFGEGDRELPLILGLMPILSKADWEGKDFSVSTIRPALGSGPYVISQVDPGASLTFRRNPDYWGRDLPINRGLHNFDEVKYLYFRDSNALWEAFTSGLVTFRHEQSAERWAQGYDFPAFRSGAVERGEVVHGRPTGMRGLVFNTRRPLFQDRRVREAVSLALDFEWLNRTLYYGAYARIQSYFGNSALGCDSGPADEAERALLAPYLGELPEGALEAACAQPVSDGSGRDRTRLRRAAALLREAGWVSQGGVLKNAAGEPFAFEILTSGVEEERVAGAFAQALKSLGIQMRARTVDAAQMAARKNDYDYDMVFNFWALSLSPGNEQTLYWGSAGREIPGTRNYMGVASPGVDAMIQALLEARDRAPFEAAARALDRLLTANQYVVPLWWEPTDKLAWRKGMRRPEKDPLYGYRPEVWWSEAP